MASRFLTIIVATSIAASACGSSGTDVRDFEEIRASDVTFEFDASATSAVLEVDTTIPVVCAVAYGPTEALGLIATDDDMSGGAHADHHPRLTGLSPETEYVFRLQGVDAAGNLYQSELMTFTTPAAAEAAPTPGANVALGATIVDVSSEFSDAFSAENAVDGDLGTEWSSAGDGDDAFIVIDLGRDVEAGAVAFRTRSMGDGTATTLTYTVSVDGGEPLGPFAADGEVGSTEVTFSGRIVRFDVDTSTGGNTGALEVEVYETP